LSIFFAFLKARIYLFIYLFLVWQNKLMSGHGEVEGRNISCSPCRKWE
jgi:hypothetical protein